MHCLENSFVLPIWLYRFTRDKYYILFKFSQIKIKMKIVVCIEVKMIEKLKFQIQFGIDTYVESIL